MKDTTEDVVLDNFGNSFMDDFHDYPSIKGLWRYQHRCVEERGVSALVCNEWIYSHLVWGKFFMFIHKVETFLGKKFPRICGIYFLVLVRPNNPEDAK